MYCPKCGTQNDDNNYKCTRCAEILQQQGRGPAFYVPPTSQTAIWSMILGIASFFYISILASIPAVILGHKAKSDIRNAGGKLGGDGMATTGIVLGYINIGLSIVVGLIILIAVLAD